MTSWTFTKSSPSLVARASLLGVHNVNQRRDHRGVRQQVGFTEGDLRDALTWVSEFDEVATLVGMLGRLREAATE